ncbi:MAG: O-antigen ligase family protein [Bacteroidales bacterium]|nr:O-antigen ligase family protein [Bacteroidales bacterium]
MSHVKNKWPMHLFFIGLGAALFGVGYASLPLLLLLFWLFKSLKREPEIIKQVFRDDDLRWILVYYLIFIVMVTVSDLVMGGKLTHLNGPLYNLAIGIYMFLGFLIAKSFDTKSLHNISHRWLTFWLFLLLVIVELRYNGIITYRHGIFVHIHILFYGVVVMGLVNFVYFIERFEIGKVISWVSGLLSLWVLVCVYRYSISDVIPHLYVAGIVLIFVFSGKKWPMYILAVLLFGLAIFMITNDALLVKLQKIDLRSPNIWMDLLNGREDIWTIALRMIGEHPLFGVGSGRFGTVSEELLMKFGIVLRDNKFSHAHNFLLHNMAVHGIIAGLAYAGLLLSVIRLIIRSLTIQETETLSIAVFCIYFTYVIYGFVTNSPLNEEMIPLIWGSIGMLGGVVSKMKENAQCIFPK